jgi:hypothetical protein
MMTGNTINGTKGMSEQNWDAVAFFFSVIMCYQVGGWVYRVTDLMLHHNTSATAVAPVVVLLLLVADLLNVMDDGPNAHSCSKT